MEDPNDNTLLLNDADAEEGVIQQVLYDIQTGLQNATSDNFRHLGPLLTSNSQDTYSHNKVLENRLTLRKCNNDYGESGGYKYGRHEVPEFDRCITKGCISPLRRFDNIIGHFDNVRGPNNTEYFRTICFTPTIEPTVESFGQSIYKQLSKSIRKGRLWNIQDVHLCTSSSSENWIYRNEEVSARLSTALSMIAMSFTSPLSAHSHHAFLESQEAKDAVFLSKIFKEPEETTAVPGLLGTIHNNQLIDLAQEDKGQDVNIQKRSENLDIPSFLCRGHTAHSGEAGRVRRVCDQVNVRILCNQLLLKLAKACSIAQKYNEGKKEWLLHCLGTFVYCTTKSLLKIRDFLISSSTTSIHSATLYINSEMHTATISITSGVLLRRDINNIIISTMSFYPDVWPDNKYEPMLPIEDSKDSLLFYFSTFFHFVPYIQFDRPPRTDIASVQSIQAVCTPYGAGTSSVAPTEVTRPLVYTPLYEEILNSPNLGLADYLPGQELIVCFANFNNTNEDGIMMSEGSISRGLYSYLAYSVNSINPAEKVPAVGQYAHIGTNRWWKTYSRRQTVPPRPESINNKTMTPILAGGDGRGRVISASTTTSGQLSVRTLRYSTTVSGDKTASPHGQKGVVTIEKEADMPWGVDENGQCIKFDMVISLSSITNRITVGQYYEMVAGAKAVREGRRIVVAPREYHNDHTETVLYSGTTGELITRLEGTEEVPVLASWGVSRIWQMTQLSWDKQHYTHNTAGLSATNAPIGRSAGGGIKIGEMDSHAMEGSGLVNVNKELQKRKTCIDVKFCTTCNETVTTCGCGRKQVLTDISIPFSKLAFDQSGIITSGYVTKYSIGF